MKKILNVIIFTLALNFLAVLAGAGAVLGMSHMTREKFGKVKEILFDTTQPAATQPAATRVAASEPADHLADLLAKASGRPAGEQISFIRQTFEGEMAGLDRKHRELLDLQHQIDLAREQVKVDRAKLEQAQKDLQDRQNLQERLASDKGFQDSLELYNAMPAKQVKTIFMALNDETIQQYLQAMEPRNAAKIMKEFKAPEETARLQKVLERIRQSQTPAASGTPVAPAGGVRPGAAQAAVPTQ